MFSRLIHWISYPGFVQPAPGWDGYVFKTYPLDKLSGLRTTGPSSPLTTSLPDIDTTTWGDNHHIITTALQDGHSRVENEVRKDPEKDILEKPLSKRHFRKTYINWTLYQPCFRDQKTKSIRLTSFHLRKIYTKIYPCMQRRQCF